MTQVRQQHQNLLYYGRHAAIFQVIYGRLEHLKIMSDTKPTVLTGYMQMSQRKNISDHCTTSITYFWDAPGGIAPRGGGDTWEIMSNQCAKFCYFKDF